MLAIHECGTNKTVLSYRVQSGCVSNTIESLGRSMNLRELQLGGYFMIFTKPYVIMVIVLVKKKYMKGMWLRFSYLYVAKKHGKQSNITSFLM